jgi:hypothetical protein
MRVAAIVLFVVSLFGLTLSLYFTAYYMWLSATPLSAERLARVKDEYFASLGAAGACLCLGVLAVGAFLWTYRSPRRPADDGRGFEVIRHE